MTIVCGLWFELKAVVEECDAHKTLLSVCLEVWTWLHFIRCSSGAPVLPPAGGWKHHSTTAYSISHSSVARHTDYWDGSLAKLGKPYNSWLRKGQTAVQTKWLKPEADRAEKDGLESLLD